MTEFLAANWLWIVLIVAVVAMHRVGGCGMRGGHQHGNRDGAAHDHQGSKERTFQ